MKSLHIPYVQDSGDTGAFATINVDCLNWPDDFPFKPEVKVSLAHDDDNLFLHWDVRGDYYRAITLENNGPVWEDSCVEFFVSVPGSGFYHNIETNCIGVCLAAKRQSRDVFTRLEDTQIEKIIRHSSLPKAVVESDKPADWNMDVTIPFQVLGIDKAPSRLMANFYKCGDKTARTHFLSWSPIDTPNPDFHRPEFFGELILD